MYRLNRGRLISLFLFALGFPALAASIILASSILAFIGLGLTFWGALLLFVTNERYVKQDLLSATAISPLKNLSQLLTDLNYHGNATYLPPHYCPAFETRVYIPRDPTDSLPTVDALQHLGDAPFFTNPDAVLIVPPGLALSKLVETKLGTRFTEVGLEQLQEVLPKLLLEDLDLAETFEIQIIPSEDNENTNTAASLPSTKSALIRVTITHSVYEDLCRDALHVSTGSPICKIGCPLCSAIACILAETLGRPMVIESVRISDDAQTIETIYQALELTERLERVRRAPRVPPASRLSNPAGLVLTASGALILAWIGCLTWYDVTTWGKDLVQIFFGSRTGEALSLGLGVKAIHYFLVGVALVFLGLLTFHQNTMRVLKAKLHSL
jgi:uncharacterized membrane protein